jgi:hypothetical protein
MCEQTRPPVASIMRARAGVSAHRRGRGRALDAASKRAQAAPYGVRTLCTMPALLRSALVPGGCRRQQNGPRMPMLPPCRHGEARHVPYGRLFAATAGREEAGRLLASGPIADDQLRPAGDAVRRASPSRHGVLVHAACTARNRWIHEAAALGAMGHRRIGASMIHVVAIDRRTAWTRHATTTSRSMSSSRGGTAERPRLRPWDGRRSGARPRSCGVHVHSRCASLFR